MKKVTVRDEDELYSQRLLVFIETEPQSNKYRQILLNTKQFKKIAFSIGKTIGQTSSGYDIVENNESDEVYTLPDLREINP